MAPSRFKILRHPVFILVDLGIEHQFLNKVCFEIWDVENFASVTDPLGCVGLITCTISSTSTQSNLDEEILGPSKLLPFKPQLYLAYRAEGKMYRFIMKASVI